MSEPSAPEQVLIVFCTFPNAAIAATVAETLVREGHAACVNVIPGVRSIYMWQGKLCDDTEYLATIKTTDTAFHQLRSRLVELHPYDVPEVLGVPATRGHEPYLQWVRDAATSAPSTNDSV